MADEKRTVLTFDAVKNYIDMGLNDEHRVERDITLEAWVYVEQHEPARAGLITKLFDNNGDESGYGLILDGEGGVSLLLRPSTNVVHEVLSSGPNTLPVKEWHHVAGTYDGATMKLYIDGKLTASAAASMPDIGYVPENKLFVGLNETNEAVPTQRFFKGKMGQVRLWNVARTEQEIKRDMNVRLKGDETGLKGYWPLDDGKGDNAEDEGILDQTGAIKGGTKWENILVPFPTASKLVEEKTTTTTTTTTTTKTTEGEGGGGAGGGAVGVPSDGVKAIIDTSGVLAAALERINRQSVVGLLQQIVDEIDTHCRTIDGKINEKISILRKEISSTIERIDTTTTNHQTQITNVGKTVDELRQRLKDLEDKGTCDCDDEIEKHVPGIVDKVKQTIETTVKDAITKELQTTSIKTVEETIKTLQDKLTIIEKSARELDENELKDVEKLITDVLGKMDLTKVLEKMLIKVGDKSYPLTDLLRLLATRVEVVSTSFGYNANDITSAKFVLSNKAEASFTATRSEPSDGVVEYLFRTLNLMGLPADFKLRFTKSTRKMTMCDKNIALDQYDAVQQSNVVYDLAPTQPVIMP